MVRVWCVDPVYLGRQRLLGQHTELHTLISVEEARVSGRKCGYQNHPTAVAYRGKLLQLKFLHNRIADEMLHRGYRHNPPVYTEVQPIEFCDDDFYWDLDDLSHRQGGITWGFTQ